MTMTTTATETLPAVLTETFPGADRNAGDVAGSKSRAALHQNHSRTSSFSRRDAAAEDERIDDDLCDASVGHGPHPHGHVLPGASDESTAQRGERGDVAAVAFAA